MKDVHTFEKLPKWARDHIAAITRQRDEAIENARRVLDSQTHTQICIDAYDNPKYVQSERVMFFRGEANAIEVSAYGDGIEVRGVGSLAVNLGVIPCCANGIMVRPLDTINRT